MTILLAIWGEMLLFIPLVAETGLMSIMLGRGGDGMNVCLLFSMVWYGNLRLLRGLASRSRPLLIYVIVMFIRLLVEKLFLY